MRLTTTLTLTEFSSLTKQVLDLSDNAIVAIPQAFGKLKKLVRISLANNEIKDKQMLRVVRHATEQGAKKLKNMVTYCNKKGNLSITVSSIIVIELWQHFLCRKEACMYVEFSVVCFCRVVLCCVVSFLGVKTKPLSGKRPKFVRVTKAEKAAAEKAAAEKAAAEKAAAEEAGVTGDVPAIPKPDDDSNVESKVDSATDGWGDGTGETWGDVTATAENNTVDPKEEARLARKRALREKREAQAAEKLRLQQLKQEESAKVEKQREEYRAKQVC